MEHHNRWGGFDRINGFGGNGHDGEHEQAAHSPNSGTEANDYLIQKYPDIAEKFGSPLHMEKAKDGSLRIKNFNDDFFAAALGSEGLTVFVVEENTFCCYSAATGIFEPARPEQLKARLSRLLYSVVQACPASPGIEALEFSFRKTSRLNGIIDRAKGLLAVPVGYFEQKHGEAIPVKNGVVRLSDRALQSHSPGYKLRRTLAVPYDPKARCPEFIGVLLKPALPDDDIELLQRWFGLVLTGQNFAQVILLLTGTAGGGKGTLARILRLLLGRENVIALRANLLQSRFELGRMLNRTLVYGADVPTNFLNTPGAGVLKAIVGGDPSAVEIKGSNARPEMTLLLNVLITANTRLRLRLEGGQDPAAWRRRLRIIQFNNRPPAKPVPDLAEQLIQDEGAGILNWAIDGLEKLRADNYNLRLNKRQQNLVEDMLAESDSVHRFVLGCLRKGSVMTSLTVTQCYTEYLDYCSAQGWNAVSRNEFGSQLPSLVSHGLGTAVRNDIPGENGKQQHGFRGLVCQRPKAH